MSRNLLSLVPCLPGKMLNNNPQIHSAGRNDFRNVCPQRKRLKTTAHESTLQRAREKRGREFTIVCQGDFKRTCEMTQKNGEFRQISRPPE